MDHHEEQPSPIARAIVERPALAPVLYAMWGRAEGQRLGRELAAAGVDVLVLKGPELQERLYGTPAAYRSSDVDVLVHRPDARRAREVMERNGWAFEPENGVLWRLSAAASFERDGFRADLHWGLHAAHLPAFALRPLERSLWERATRDPSGFMVPDAESLFVFLAVHAAGHGFERPEWIENVHAAASQVEDWRRAWSIAAANRVSEAVRAAMSEQVPGTQIAVLDGPLGRTVWWATYVARGHVIPRRARDHVREAWGLHREGFGFLGRRRDRVVRVGELDLIVGDGVFEPQGVTVRGLDLADELLDGSIPRVVIDIGTGSGSVAISAARRWPSAEVHGTDVSPRAVRYAKANAERLGVDNVHFHVGDLLQPLPEELRGSVDLVVSNVPYVPTAGGKSLGGWNMPTATIFGTEADGLGYMRDLCSGLPRFLRPGALWVFQIGDPQLEPWAAHLASAGFEPWLPSGRRPGKAIVAAARNRKAGEA